MAGHSHSSNIAHRKAAVDGKRAKLWSKLARGIIVAAKMGGGDPDANLKLRYAIADAKAVSMPRENIERAIKKGTGELESEALDETIYEGYGPGGIAIMCEILTDNRNRTAPEIRKIFEGNGGKLGSTNCVSWLFERKGAFVVSAAKASGDKLMEVTLDAGAEDIKNEGDVFLITCPVDAFMAVADALTAAGIEPESKQITRIPKSTVEVTDPEAAKNVLELVELLDDHDDVQSVSANFSITDKVLAAAGK